MLIGGMTICKGKTNNHVRILSDKKQNFLTFLIWSIKGRVNQNHVVKLQKKLWILCAHLKIWISAAHLPEIQNTDENGFSREFNEAIQWKLKPKLFEKNFQRIWYASNRSFLRFG